MSRRAYLRGLHMLLILLILASIFLNGIITNNEASDQGSIKVRIDRLVQVELDGAVIIEDSVKLSTNASEGVNPLTNFIMGLPHKFMSNIFYLSAYDRFGELNHTRGVDLEGFYGIDIRFRGPIDLVIERSYEFKVVCVLSGLVSFETVFNVSLPFYPVLGQEIDFYNLTVILPARTTCLASSVDFNNKTKTIGYYPHSILNRSESNIGPLANMSSWITFQHSGFPELFLLLEINLLTREIRIDPWGNLLVSDSYQFTHKGENLAKINLFLPRNATDISVLDVYGLLPWVDKVDQDSIKYIAVDLLQNNREALKRNDKIKLTIKYKLPLSKYIKQDSFEDYTLTADFLNLINRTANRVVVKVVLPEGAKIQTSKRDTEDIANVTRFHNLNFNLKYRYNIFWSSLRPVVWSGVFSAISCLMLFFLVRAAKITPTIIAPAPPEFLQKFVDYYEEKMRIAMELRSMERQVRRGKISRRRYKVRRISLENRLMRLQKELTSLRSEITAAGRVYADLMRQLEVTEAELETLDEDIRRVEARHHRGELSAEARQRLLDDYSRRRERAENTISGVILRLREELR